MSVMVPPDRSGLVAIARGCIRPDSPSLLTLGRFSSDPDSRALRHVLRNIAPDSGIVFNPLEPAEGLRSLAEIKTMPHLENVSLLNVGQHQIPTNLFEDITIFLQAISEATTKISLAFNQRTNQLIISSNQQLPGNIITATALTNFGSKAKINQNKRGITINLDPETTVSPEIYKFGSSFSAAFGIYRRALFLGQDNIMVISNFDTGNISDLTQLNLPVSAALVVNQRHATLVLHNSDQPGNCDGFATYFRVQDVKSTTFRLVFERTANGKMSIGIPVDAPASIRELTAKLVGESHDMQANRLSH